MEKKPRSTRSAAATPVRRSSSRSQAQGADLATVFNVAAKTLAANRSALNESDLENHNHGDNMAQAFKMIAKAMSQERGAPPSQQLRYASEYLAQNANSGSAHVYSQGLAQAAQQFQGQQAITPDNAMLLLQGLLGGGQQSSSSPGADLLGSLLGGQQVQQTEGIDLAALVSAGLTFMSAKQQGQDNVQAALTALMSSGPMAQRSYRQQSGQMVGNALLQAIASMAKRK